MLYVRCQSVADLYFVLMPAAAYLHRLVAVTRQVTTNDACINIVCLRRATVASAERATPYWCDSVSVCETYVHAYHHHVVCVWPFLTTACQQVLVQIINFVCTSKLCALLRCYFHWIQSCTDIHYVP